ncbi:MAG: PASTA domain-containing protein [Proteobacteria bacterium]|nr:PASTA domain-containing protein [Pseudomonadota bacterium]
MEYDEYTHGPKRSLDAFAVVLISLVTSTLTTLAVLWLTGNLSALQQEPESEKSGVEKYRQVPSLVGMPTETAIELLRARNLRMIVRAKRHDKSAAEGTIIEQDPLPDSELEIKGEVAVIVSDGIKQVTVPEIVGKSVKNAEKLIKAEGLEMGSVSNTGTGDPGTVTQSAPQSGTKVEGGAKIDLIVAPTGLGVPSVVGMGKRQARKKIKKAGFKVGKIRWRYNEYKPANIVLSQNPAADSQAPAETLVNLVINEE